MQFLGMFANFYERGKKKRIKMETFKKERERKKKENLMYLKVLNDSSSFSAFQVNKD